LHDLDGERVHAVRFADGSQCRDIRVSDSDRSVADRQFSVIGIFHHPGPSNFAGVELDDLEIARVCGDRGRQAGRSRHRRAPDRLAARGVVGHWRKLARARGQRLFGKGGVIAESVPKRTLSGIEERGLQTLGFAQFLALDDFGGCDSTYRPARVAPWDRGARLDALRPLLALLLNLYKGASHGVPATSTHRTALCLFG